MYMASYVSPLPITQNQSCKRAYQAIAIAQLVTCD